MIILRSRAGGGGGDSPARIIYKKGKPVIKLVETGKELSQDDIIMGGWFAVKFTNEDLYILNDAGYFFEPMDRMGMQSLQSPE